MKPVRHIVDTTMRDGEQSPGFAMTGAQKIETARLLDSAGVYQIEAGIPAMGTEEMNTISQITQNRKHSKISAWNRLNLEDIKKSITCKPDIIHISVPVSYVLIYSKLNKNKTWVTKSLSACVDFALGCGFEVTVGFEDASRADMTFMITLAKLLKDMGVSRIRFADTVGILSPSRTFQSINEIISYSGIEVEIHVHNDLGMAVANSILGAKAGAKYIDTTILGIGERAGNCDFYKLISAAEETFKLDLSFAEALAVQRRISGLLNLCTHA